MNLESNPDSLILELRILVIVKDTEEHVCFSLSSFFCYFRTVKYVGNFPVQILHFPLGITKP